MYLRKCNSCNALIRETNGDEHCEFAFLGFSRPGPGTLTFISLMSETQQKIKSIWKYLEEVCDPEVPVLSVIDLGIIRDVELNDPGDAIVTISPTYSGCPAMDVIRLNIRLKLAEHGFRNTKIITQLSPAWTTDWMSEKGKDKLKAYGIAPPNPKQLVCNHDLFQQEESIQCPRCNSYNTRMISQFGSTACKALYQCNNCYEPFDYFKCH
jgi:ring-1,2-phenylacetyl-CoA epoxidase subunit PaaD